MNSITKGLVKSPTVKHAKMIIDCKNYISDQRKYYKSYSAVNMSCKFKEYEVLELAMLSLINNREFNPPVIEFTYLSSVVRSFKLLECRYLSSVGEKNFDFIMVLEHCREVLELIGIELFYEFQAEIW